MLNSSLNFIIYIIYGPGKFREDFVNLINCICYSFSNCFNKLYKRSNIREQRRNNSIFMNIMFDYNNKKFNSKNSINTLENSTNINNKIDCGENKNFEDEDYKLVIDEETV